MTLIARRSPRSFRSRPNSGDPVRLLTSGRGVTPERASALDPDVIGMSAELRLQPNRRHSAEDFKSQGLIGAPALQVDAGLEVSATRRSISARTVIAAPPLAAAWPRNAGPRS